MTKNLALRSNAGITISLDFDSDSEAISVSVKSESDDFVMREIPHKLALDVFNHPYAYASRLLTAGTFAGIAQ